MQKRFVLFLLLLMLGLVVSAQEQPVYQYSRVEINVPTENLAAFQKLGFSIDECVQEWHGDYCRYIVPLNQFELKLLSEQKSFSYKVLVKDVQKFYASRNTAVDQKLAAQYRKSLGTGMKLGSMGGFYTVEEIYQNLDKLYAKYGKKNLISKRKSIGKSYEGRDIYVIKISDHVNRDESKSEPEILYTALIHAREPAGMMTLFYFMHYLLENYENDSRVRSIVDNHEIYIIPLVNPDGYAYNQKGHPNGGGMQRKNRHGYGVDLNRNFGPHDLWDYPNNGSSTSQWSQTYRGTAAFSEPETQALRDFVGRHKFRTTLNYHTYSNLLIYPWGYKNVVAHPMFPKMAKEMTKINGYRYGTAQGLLYAVRGDSDSWFYKAFKVFAMTPEVGGRGDGFWPRSSRIFPLAKENLESNLLLAEYADQVPSK